jgi:hypothetical protein
MTGGDPCPVKALGCVRQIKPGYKHEQGPLYVVKASSWELTKYVKQFEYSLN